VSQVLQIAIKVAAAPLCVILNRYRPVNIVLYTSDQEKEDVRGLALKLYVTVVYSITQTKNVQKTVRHNILQCIQQNTKNEQIQNYAKSSKHS